MQSEHSFGCMFYQWNTAGAKLNWIDVHLAVHGNSELFRQRFGLVGYDFNIVSDTYIAFLGSSPQKQ